MIYKIKNLIFFVLYIILNPKLLRILFQKPYLPVFIQFKWLKKFDIKTIIDIGAHRGNVSRTLNYLFSKATIFAFEPSKENCMKISEKIRGRNIIINNIALSGRSGVSSFFEYDNDSLSSLFQKKENVYKKTVLLKTWSVRTTTLDSFFKNKKLKPHIFLKIDTQGTEGVILKGGKRFLNQVSLIHIEVSFEEYYKGQELFSEIYKYLTSLGFCYAGENRESHFYPSFAPASQINVIFFNKKLIPSFY